MHQLPLAASAIPLWLHRGVAITLNPDPVTFWRGEEDCPILHRYLVHLPDGQLAYAPSLRVAARLIEDRALLRAS
jgi:hypothetical protein